MSLYKKNLLLAATILTCTTSSIAWAVQAPSVYEEEALTVEQIIRAAEEGNINAQFNLGYMYSSGDGVERDYKKAFEWYLRAAERGDADAMLNVGIMYSHGEGVLQNYEESVKWYTRSAELGNRVAQYNLGVVYSQGKGVSKDLSQAAEWYRRAAEAGDVTAQFNLAEIFANGGPGVLQDFKTAFRWYAEAARNGNTDALAILDNIEYDEYAVSWFEVEANKGDPFSQVQLAHRYALGKGVSQNSVQAYKWFNIAATLGEAEAREERDKLEKGMLPKDVLEAQKLSREWFENGGTPSHLDMDEGEGN